MTAVPVPASRDEALDVVCAELRRELNLGDAPLTDTDDLDLIPGADSVRLMRVVADLERRYDVEFDDDAIRKAATVGDMADLLLAGVAGDER